MKEVFLFGLAFLWLLFASIYDIKKREVPNWLNFSLLAFALAYRGFYAIENDNWMFLVYGLIGVGICWILALGMYYGRVFAGGDAKLLIALGAILPYESLYGVLYNIFGFVFLLFLFGMLWGIVYSIFIVGKDLDRFKLNFRKNAGKYRSLIMLGIIFGAIMVILGIYGWEFIFIGCVLIGISLLYVYLKSVESCMIRLVDSKMLTEGDWIMGDIKVGNKYIKKTVHGLSREDIKLLQKGKRNILIKEGIPFVPSFLFAFVFMVFFLAKFGSFVEVLKTFLI